MSYRITIEEIVPTGESTDWIKMYWQTLESLDVQALIIHINELKPVRKHRKKEAT